MFQTSLLLMKSLNKIETFVFLSVACSFFSKGNLFFLQNYPKNCLFSV